MVQGIELLQENEKRCATEDGLFRVYSKISRFAKRSKEKTATTMKFN